MSISFVKQPENFIFARDPQVIEAISTASNRAGSEANALITHVGGPFEDSTLVISNTNIGLNINWLFKNAPNSSQKLSFDGSDFDTLQEYASKYLVPELMKVEALRANYTLNIRYSGTTDTTTIEILAKKKGVFYNLTTSSNIGGFIEDFAGVEEIDNSGILRADIICKKLKYQNTKDVIEESQPPQTINTIPTTTGRSHLNLSATVLTFLEPFLLDGRQLSQQLSGIGALPHLAKFVIVFSEKVLSGETIPDTKIITFIAIRGSLPTPYLPEHIRIWWQQTTQTPYPRLLTNQPQYCPISPLVVLTHSYLNLQPTAGATPGFRILRILKTGTVSPFNYADNNPNSHLIACRFPVDYTGNDMAELHLIPANTQTSPDSSPNMLRLNIDHRPYDTENFFFFFNTLGGTDLAWFTGALEIELSGQFIDFQTALNKAMLLDSHTSKSETQEIIQSFRISTGWKPKSVIQWMAEIVASEKIRWYTKSQMQHHIQFLRGERSDPAPYQHIALNRESITYYNSLNGQEAFTIEFTAAIQQNALLRL